VDGTPASVDDARTELAQVDAWLQETHARKQQEVQVLTRAAYLNGYLAAHAAPDAEDEPT
jgi:hypothetical protein